MKTLKVSPAIAEPVRWDGFAQGDEGLHGAGMVVDVLRKFGEKRKK